VFAVGLGLAGMTRPGKVLAFLDVRGAWDPSLAFVMVGAIATHVLLRRPIVARRAPVLAPRFALPVSRDIDGRLVAGATIFGVGWGLAGFCPGPAITSLAGGHAEPAMFVAAMLTGMTLYRVVLEPKGGTSMETKAPLTAALLVLAVCALAGAEAHGQAGPRWRGGGGWGPHGPYGRMYDPKTVETVRGTVVSVDEMTPRSGMGPGVHLRLKTDAETVSVHVGPSWYVEHQDARIEPNDEVEVKGSRVSFDGKPAILAAEIRKGTETLLLRDANGVPLWAGWRRRN
jgi:uncharacterized membrane protein YedE/YeeE